MSKIKQGQLLLNPGDTLGEELDNKLTYARCAKCACSTQGCGEV